MTFESMEKETDCAIYPRMIRKPTTTMAPTTAEMEAETGLRAGDIAAIILAVILIILIILIILFAVYLWKTKKMRHVAPISLYIIPVGFSCCMTFFVKTSENRATTCSDCKTAANLNIIHR